VPRGRLKLSLTISIPCLHTAAAKRRTSRLGTELEAGSATVAEADPHPNPSPCAVRPLAVIANHVIAPPSVAPHRDQKPLSRLDD
jgi:hypothetical protein